MSAAWHLELIDACPLAMPVLWLDETRRVTVGAWGGGFVQVSRGGGFKTIVIAASSLSQAVSMRVPIA